MDSDNRVKFWLFYFFIKKYKFLLEFKTCYADLKSFIIVSRSLGAILHKMP